MITFGPVFGDYAIMACSCAWLAWRTRDAVHEVSALIRRWRRRRSSRITLRITSSRAPWASVPLPEETDGRLFHGVRSAHG